MIKCPVCGEYKFERIDNFDVCPVCEWENDSLQMKNPDYRGGANDESLNDARSVWAEKKAKIA